MNVTDLKRGQKARIVDISAEEIPLKLMEMGCLPGNEISLVQRIPFKDPMYLNINDTHLAIRRNTAELITIELMD